MPLSRTEVANRALDAIGADNIASVNDQTKAAALCNRRLSALRDELLRQHPWNFASERASLPALLVAPVWGFQYAYQLPADYLRLVKLNVVNPRTPYKIESNRIVTDSGAPLQILYVARINDFGRFDPLFANVLMLMLGRDLAMPLTNNASLRAQLAKEAQDALRDARSADAAEGLPDDIWSDDLINARLA